MDTVQSPLSRVSPKPLHQGVLASLRDLIIHNELDFRVPIGQGMSLFTTLQRQGVPSKLLYFPDEGHWVLKPQNAQFWYKTFLDWLALYLK